VAAVLHHSADMATGDFHKVSNEGVEGCDMSSCSLAHNKLGQTSSSQAGPSYGVIERRHCRASEHKGAVYEGPVGAERFRLSDALSNTSADDSLDPLAERD
jgi:hypothetical protein